MGLAIVLSNGCRRVCRGEIGLCQGNRVGTQGWRAAAEEEEGRPPEAQVGAWQPGQPDISKMTCPAEGVARPSVKRASRPEIHRSAAGQSRSPKPSPSLSAISYAGRLEWRDDSTALPRRADRRVYFSAPDAELRRDCAWPHAGARQCDDCRSVRVLAFLAGDTGVLFPRHRQDGADGVVGGSDRGGDVRDMHTAFGHPDDGGIRCGEPSRRANRETRDIDAAPACRADQIRHADPHGAEFSSDFARSHAVSGQGYGQIPVKGYPPFYTVARDIRPGSSRASWCGDAPIVPPPQARWRVFGRLAPHLQGFA
jgi:hypothetical protein